MFGLGAELAVELARPFLHSVSSVLLFIAS